MTRSIIGAIGAAIVTAGIGATTAYTVHKRNAPEAPAASAQASADVSSVEVRDGARQSVKLGGLQVEQDGTRQSAKIGKSIVAEQGPDGQSVKIGKGISAQQNADGQSVKLGKGIAVSQSGQDASVQVGGTRIDSNGNKQHVKIGGLDVTSE